MYKLRSTNLSLIAICLTTIACTQPPPSMADNGSAGYSPPGQSASTAAPSASKKPFSFARLPLYVAGVATGAVVGMPISLVRRFLWEEKQGIQGLCGDSTNKVAIVSAGAFWLPFSAFLGAGEAPVMGPVNSLKNYDKPFSKEQFSLGTIGDSSGRDPG